MHEEPADIAASLEPVGDLEYDLSHETIAPSDGSNGAETERDEAVIGGAIDIGLTIVIAGRHAAPRS